MSIVARILRRKSNEQDTKKTFNVVSSRKLNDDLKSQQQKNDLIFLEFYNVEDKIKKKEAAYECLIHLYSQFLKHFDIETFSDKKDKEMHCEAFKCFVQLMNKDLFYFCNNESLFEQSVILWRAKYLPKSYIHL